jgi:DNA-binding response OmpR family regulator
MQTPARILYVEDHPDTLELVSFVLRENGFEIVTVVDPEEAIRLAQTGRFNLYILDNWLEDKSGIELCTRLREFDSTTPILFFSGAAREQDKQNAIDCGAQGYVVKPSTPDTLVVEIRKLIAASANA